MGIPETNEEVEDALLELPQEDIETQQAQQIILDAKDLEKQGRLSEAKVLWEKAKVKVRELLAKARASKTSFNYLIAAIAALAIIGGAVYYSSTMRRPKPPGPLQGAIQLPAMPSEPPAG